MEKPLLIRQAAFFIVLGTPEILAAAKRELGGRILHDPIRVCCPRCGRFAVRIMVVPNLVGAKCHNCASNIIILVSRECEVLAATER
jgi:hypothetical protein